MTTQDTPERLLTTREVAGLLGLPVNTVVRLWQQKRIPGYVLGQGRIVRFRASEVEAWLQTQKRDVAS